MTDTACAPPPSMKMGAPRCATPPSSSSRTLESRSSTTRRWRCWPRAAPRVEGTRVRIPRALVDDARCSRRRGASRSRRAPEEPVSRWKPARSATAPAPTACTSGPGPRDRRQSRSPTSKMAALQEAAGHRLRRRWRTARAGRRVRAGGAVRRHAARHLKPVIMVPEAAPTSRSSGDGRRLRQRAESWAVTPCSRRRSCTAATPPSGSSASPSWTCPWSTPGAYLQGATAPFSRAACVLLTNAEMLSGLVITELAKPGHRYVYGVTQGP